jgi:dTDP-4-dehydrorhamnose 3,5-epimerase
MGFAMPETNSDAPCDLSGSDPDARDLRSDPEQPHLIQGGLHVDNRGVLAFFNDFAFSGVERFYIIRPARPNEIRGWMGHRRDQKWFSAVEGALTVAVVRPDNWEKPSAAVPVSTFVLSAVRPAILAVPAGHATAIIGRSNESALLVFSTGTIAEAPSDSYRFAPDLWPIPRTA